MGFSFLHCSNELQKEIRDFLPLMQTGSGTGREELLAIPPKMHVLHTVQVMD